LKNEKPVKPQKVEGAEGLTDSSPEEVFFFVFVCRGQKSAYKQIEEFIKGKTSARVVFQRISRNYMVISELKTKPLGVVKDVR